MRTDITTSLNAWKAYMDCLVRCARDAAQNGEERPVQAFVTISRQVGAGGITIGEKLALYLKERDKAATCPWTVFDRNLVERVLEEHRLSEEFAKFMPEKKVSEIQDMIEEMCGLHPDEWALAYKTKETILHLAYSGNVVIVGRGGNLLTRRLAQGFHVRLVGSMKKRVTHVQEYYGMNEREAVEFITEEDKGRKDYLRYHFDKDIDDPMLYHLVINTDLISYDDGAQIIGGQVLKFRVKCIFPSDVGHVSNVPDR